MAGHAGPSPLWHSPPSGDPLRAGRRLALATGRRRKGGLMDQPDGPILSDELADRAEHLRSEFSPMLAPEVIDREVDEASAEFRDARVTTYVPILIERLTRDRLKTRARAIGTPGG